MCGWAIFGNTRAYRAHQVGQHMTQADYNEIPISNHSVTSNRPDWLSSNLAAGLYVRKDDINLPAYFSDKLSEATLSETCLDWKCDRTLANIFTNVISWPVTDIIVDIDQRIVWFDKGQVSVSFRESNQEKSDLYVF